MSQKESTNNGVDTSGLLVRRTRLQQCGIDFRMATAELLAQRQRADIPPEIHLSIDRLVSACESYAHAQADVFSEALDRVTLKVSRMEAALTTLCDVDLRSP